VSELAASVCSIAPTRRRRFLWAAWWSGPPSREPFRRPDAWSGGARTPAEAQRAAELAAGRELQPIEARWARAWARVLQGQPPWLGRPAEAEPAAPARSPDRAPTQTPWHVVLGVAPLATVLEIKRAFRKRALETHPDHGGDPAEFRRVHRAYEQAQKRQARPRSRRRR
jgi:hypothetical protein